MEVTPRQASENVLYFSKFHAAGNDFVLVDGINHPRTPSWWHHETIYKLCHRHYGIGGDGLIVLLDSKDSDYRMKYFNADGHEAEMCGNGLRCLALFIRDQGHSVSTPMSIETLSGQVSVEIMADGLVKVAMPPISFARANIPMRGDGECINDDLKIDKNLTLKITALSIGNPHVVLFGDYGDEQFYELGPMISVYHAFPEGANVHFVKVEGMDTIVQRVWERGVGPTLACGSGAVAAVAAGIANNLLPFNAKIRVKQPGGELSVAVADGYRESTLEGEAVYVYHGVVEF
ncbi:diaminopimelate epimerase [bacterium]|nr:diaminopimelate epimerase [bacterium]MBU1651360.1 diaminopimelate epimerase [bacterium]MBU1880668.1 diaminopimelate epimerase [bacterium]